MFSDEWLDKEENTTLLDILLCWLLRKPSPSSPSSPLVDFQSERVDVENLIREVSAVPSIQGLSTSPRPCLQDNEELPLDFSLLFQTDLFSFSTKLVPEIIDIYERMGLTHETLNLIQPQFETPLPPLEAAVFPPILRELKPPALDQFDLDEHFASDYLRLAQIANKCLSLPFFFHPLPIFFLSFFLGDRL